MATELKRTTIFLTEEQHEGLRRLAFEKKTSMAKLIRERLSMYLNTKKTSRKE